MKNTRYTLLMKSSLFVLMLMAQCVAFAQGTKEDYQRAFNLWRQYSNKMTHGNVQLRDERDGRFRYSVYTGDSTAWYEVNAKTGEKTVCDAPEARRNHWGGGERHHWAEVRDEKEYNAFSPIETALYIYHKDNNLFLHDKRDGSDRQLTFDGVDTCYYSSWGSWSSDGKRYATVMIKPAPKHYITLTQSSPEGQVQPKYHTMEYNKPGDSLNIRIPVVIDIATATRILPKSLDAMMPQYYLTAPVWTAGNDAVTFEYNARGHKVYRVMEMDMKGDVRTLIEEKNDKYVAYSRNLRRDLKDGRILWKSERDGRAHLYIYNRGTGRLKQITKGDFWVRDVIAIEGDGTKDGYIIFTANGKDCANMGKVASSLDGTLAQEDPYFIQAFRVGLDGKSLVCLTPEKANHSVRYNRESKTIVDTYSTVSMPPVTVLRNSTDGAVISELERADITALQANGWKAPEVFVAPGRDGKTDIWGLIQRPSNFDPTKKYPVIEYIYSGPGGQYVPKTFTPMMWWLSDIAELGFIVVQIDGMTTSYRTLDFEQVCYKNLKDAGFPDRIEWMKAAAEKYPYMDIERVGIYGSSAGGQEALGALLFYPDFYKAGYAACGCHDNRMDKIWWNEQWMGWPVDSSYIESSNVENAYRLKGKLMLVVGEMDDNVDPSSTYQVVNALIKAKKDFEFVLLPNAKHTMGESYGDHKRYDFFVKTLLGVEPPAWETLNGK